METLLMSCIDLWMMCCAPFSTESSATLGFLAEFCVQTAQSSFRNTNIAKPYLLNCKNADDVVGRLFLKY